MHRRHLTLALMISLVGAGCGNGPTSPEQFVAVQTEQGVYEPGQSAVVTVENLGFQSVGFHHCNYRFGFLLERLDGTEWLEEYEHRTICVGILPMGVYELEPGVVYRDSVQIEAPGTYRIRFPVAERDALLESNTFEILPSSSGV